MRIRITLNIGHNAPRVEDVEIEDLGYRQEDWERFDDQQKKDVIANYVAEEGWVDLGYEVLTT